jgi:hypothetical protein
MPSCPAAEVESVRRPIARAESVGAAGGSSRGWRTTVSRGARVKLMDGSDDLWSFQVGGMALKGQVLTAPAYAASPARRRARRT